MKILYGQLKTIHFLTVVCLGMMGVGQAHAALTPAKTVIENLATLNFSVGGSAQPVIESSPTGNTLTGVGAGTKTNFAVDRRINLTVVTTNTAPVVVGLGNPLMITNFNVTNTTNDTIDIKLSTIANLANGSIGATGTDTYDFINGACTTYLASAPTVAITSLVNVAQDATVAVIVKCDIKDLASLAPAVYASMQNQINVISLVGQAAAATTPTVVVGGASETTALTAGTVFTASASDTVATVDNVFGDEAGGAVSAGGTGTTNNGAGDSNDTYRDGKHSANSAYKILMPKLKVTKTELLICDPLNGVTSPKFHIPGALVQYSIKVENDVTALASGKLTTVLDILQNDLAFDTAFIVPTSASTCVPVVGTTGFKSINSVTSPTVQVRPSTVAVYTNPVADDGAGIAGQNITVDYLLALPAVGVTHTAGEIKPGEAITVTFQAFVK